MDEYALSNFWYELDLFYDGEEIRDFKKINENIKFYLKL